MVERFRYLNQILLLRCAGTPGTPTAFLSGYVRRRTRIMWTGRQTEQSGRRSSLAFVTDSTFSVSRSSKRARGRPTTSTLSNSSHASAPGIRSRKTHALHLACDYQDRAPCRLSADAFSVLCGSQRMPERMSRRHSQSSRASSRLMLSMQISSNHPSLSSQKPSQGTAHHNHLWTSRTSLCLVARSTSQPDTLTSEKLPVANPPLSFQGEEQVRQGGRKVDVCRRRR